MMLSIIIDNYNYDRFLADSIDSALAVRWPDKEIIVVDDGSTDNSHDLIASYGDRVVPLFKPNGGQNDAVNAAIARSSGEWILVLDADDMVLPSVAEAALASPHPEAAVVQWGMQYVDRQGKGREHVWPVFTAADTTGSIKQAMATTGYYDASATSANLWARRFLEEIGPLPTRDEHGLGYFDDYLHLLAPFFGEVVCLPSVQTLYRVHGTNNGYVGGFSPEAMARMCAEDLLRLRLVDEVLRRTKRTSLGEAGVTWDNLLEHMSHRLVHKRFSPETYPLNETIGTVVRKYLGAVRRSGKSPKQQAISAAWGMAIAATPLSVARRAGEIRAGRAAHWLDLLRSSGD
ncbi:MAG: glycosyl transferase [Rhodospirillales bacterium]|nr:glycosyl transferase [Rhodospirillales bacterium]